MANVYFLHRIKHSKAGAWDKGIEVKDTAQTDSGNLDAAFQSYHAYLGAYAYGHDASTDYVCCAITDRLNSHILEETWIAPEASAEPEA